MPLVKAVSFSHSTVLNISNIARECQVQRKTVAGYLEVLEDLLLSYRVRVFTRRTGRKVASHPKFFLFDTGVYRSLRPSGPLDRREEIEGQALEGLVGQHLRAGISDHSRRSRRIILSLRLAGNYDKAFGELPSETP